MNVLLTCVGRRDYLVDYFKQAVGDGGLVFGANTYIETAGMCAVDKGFVVPSFTDKTYIDVILRICMENQVRLVVPLIDMDVVILSEAREQFAQIGTIVVTPTPEVSRLCVDKWETHLWACQIGLNSPTTFKSLVEAENAIKKGEIDFPLVLKPRMGIGSIGIEFVMDLKELRKAFNKSKVKSLSKSSNDLLIQEKLVGIEYGIDVFNDLSGKYIASFVKEKLEMRAGETDRARTIEDASISKVGEKIANNLCHFGNIDVDIITVESKPYLLEINPRFGGHYPFAHAAGVNLPAALVSMASGVPVNDEWLKMAPGMTSVKGNRIVRIPPIN